MWRVLGWVEHMVATSVDSWVAESDRKKAAMKAAKTDLMMVDYWVEQ